MSYKSRRDNFSQSAITILYKRAGGKCCRCGAATFGPVTNNPTKYRNIGQAAHIAAAAPGGPRFDPDMSVEDRTSATNGLWLCSNCHDVVDRDVEEFTIKRLREIKREGEERARREVGVASSFQRRRGGSQLDTGISAAVIVEIRKHKADLLQLHGQQLELEEAQEFLDSVQFINFEVDSYLPQVGTELVAFLAKVVVSSSDGSIALEVIRRLKQAADAFHTSWNKEEVETISSMIHSLTEGRSRRTRVYQSAAALLKDLSTYSELKKKKLHTVPRKLLQSLMSTDEPDIGPPPTKKVAHDSVPEEDPDEKYLNLMQQLACTEDTDSTLQLESQLVDMGYEPNVV